MKEKYTRFLLSFFLALALYCACAVNASADDQVDAEALHVAVDGSGAYLFSIHGVLSEGDEYIAGDNVLYRITTVHNGNAVTNLLYHPHFVRYHNNGNAQGLVNFFQQR